MNERPSRLELLEWVRGQWPALDASASIEAARAILAFAAEAEAQAAEAQIASADAAPGKRREWSLEQRQAQAERMRAQMRALLGSKPGRTPQICKREGCGAVVTNRRSEYCSRSCSSLAKWAHNAGQPAPAAGEEKPRAPTPAPQIAAAVPSEIPAPHGQRNSPSDGGGEPETASMAPAVLKPAAVKVPDTIYDLLHWRRYCGDAVETAGPGMWTINGRAAINTAELIRRTNNLRRHENGRPFEIALEEAGAAAAAPAEHGLSMAAGAENAE